VPAKSNAEWQKWGEVDPLFGVASWSGRGVKDAKPWTDEEFYSMGESDWADFLNQWQSFGVEPGVCVEIGSGAARLTRPMASFFQHVHGVDVAPGMIAKAEPAVAGLPVTLHLSDGLRLPLDDASCDAAFSTHVFQHIDAMADAEMNWREIARVLKPGGTFLVHLPVHQWPGGLAQLQAVYNARRKLGDWRADAKRRRMEKAGGAPIMRGQSYAWNELEPFLESAGFTDLELRFFRVHVNHGQHAIVLGRKAAR
jgi:ubiquinone/menaquinone biosynthesis C-methylase UbiE